MRKRKKIEIRIFYFELFTWKISSLPDFVYSFPKLLISNFHNFRCWFRFRGSKLKALNSKNCFSNAPISWLDLVKEFLKRIIRITQNLNFKVWDINKAHSTMLTWQCEVDNVVVNSWTQCTVWPCAPLGRTLKVIGDPFSIVHWGLKKNNLKSIVSKTFQVQRGV